MRALLPPVASLLVRRFRFLIAYIFQSNASGGHTRVLNRYSLSTRVANYSIVAALFSVREPTNPSADWFTSITVKHLMGYSVLEM